MSKRKMRRVQYEPHLTAAKVLNNDVYRTITYVVYSAKMPTGAGQIAKQVSKLLGRTYTQPTISSYLRRLEKWGVVRPFRDPNSGHLLWWKADTTTAEIIAQELGKQEMKKIVETIEEY